MVKLAMPLVVFNEMNWFRALSCTPPLASATSSPLPPAGALFCVERKRRATPVGAWLMTASSQKPPPRDRGKLGVHLQPRGAAGEEQVWQAGLRGDGSVDQEGVVDQDALGTPFDREPGGGRVAAHQGLRRGGC